MRIVFLAVSASLGGAERVLVEMISAARKAEPGWEVSLVAPGEGPLARRTRELGARVEVLPFPRALAEMGEGGARRRSVAFAGRMALSSWPVLRYVADVRRVLARSAPDVVHANGLKASVLGALARPARSALVWHFHDYLSSRPVTTRMVRRLAGRARMAVAVSESVAADVRLACGARLPIVSIHNAIDLDVFTPDGPSLDLDEACGLPPAAPGTVRAGLVATMAHWKGHETFLKALAALKTDVPVRGYVVGGPIYTTRGSQRTLDELKELARSLGLEGRAGFTGFVEEPARAMRALDIVVHASTEPEPFGLVVAEGMACGRAVVAAGHGGVMEFVEPGVDVLLHPPGDHAALAECIASLAADSELRMRMGQQGRSAALRRFSRDRFSRQLIDVYGGLAACAFST